MFSFHSDLVRDSFSPHLPRHAVRGAAHRQHLPAISDSHSHYSRLPHVNYSGSEGSVVVLPNSPRRSPCFECGTPTPATLRARFLRRKIHTRHALEHPLRPPLLSGVRRCKETTPGSHGRRFPTLHWQGTFHKATGCGIRRT